MNDAPASAWPFDQPRNSVAFTMRQILDGSEPILLVTHDEDYAWQFIGTSDACLEDSRLVALETMVELDATILELADLPPGWQATRSHFGAEWIRRIQPPDSE